MNFEDVPTEGLMEFAESHYETRSALGVIFGRQSELLEKYHRIEEDILSRPISLPPNLHDARGQDLLKQRAWWVTEELAEAVDAFLDSKEKTVEELADALHFYTELMILARVDWRDIDGSEGPRNYPYKCDLPPRACFSLRTMAIIRELGMGMWQLRNKPWKQSQVLTDKPQLRRRLTAGYIGLLVLLEGLLGGNINDVALIYLRKSEVNKFRIESKY